jgi:hypothetical protein
VTLLPPNKLAEVGELIGSAKKFARRYRDLTGRPLGITGEVAEYEACRLLGLELADVRSPGYDAVRKASHSPVRLQIKARVLTHEKAGGRMGSIDTTKEWDAVLLVILEQDFEPLAIYEAPRALVVAAIEKPGSKARNERHALSVQQFRAIAQRVWPPAND